MKLQPIATVKEKIKEYEIHPPQDDAEIRWILNDIGHSIRKWLQFKRKWIQWGQELTEDDYATIEAFQSLIRSTILNTTYHRDGEVLQREINLTRKAQAVLEDSMSLTALQNMIVSTRWIDIDEEFSIK